MMDQPAPLIRYQADSALRRPGLLVGQMIRDLGDAWRIGVALFQRNLQAQYRQSLLGYLWVIFPPLCTTLIWVFLQHQNVVQIDAPGSLPYVVYVLTGLLFWQGFLDALQAPVRLVLTSKIMLAKLSFPREALVVAGLLTVLFNFVIRLTLLAAVMGWYGIAPATTVWLTPAAVVPLLLLGTLLGVLLSPLALLYEDVSFALASLTQVWLYLTPVVYPPPSGYPARLLNVVNPVSPLLITARDWTLTGAATMPMAFAAVTIATLVVLLLAWVGFRLAMPLVVERMMA